MFEFRKCIWFNGSLSVRDLEYRVDYLPLDEEEEVDDDEAKFSEDEEKPKPKKPQPQASGGQGQQTRAPQVDFTKLPVLDNNTLRYLPEMQYFPLGKHCPLQPVNEVAGKSLMTLINMPNGGFICMAIPLEAVEMVTVQK